MEPPFTPSLSPSGLGERGNAEWRPHPALSASQDEALASLPRGLGPKRLTAAPDQFAGATPSAR